jgi:hypothetical protein
MCSFREVDNIRRIYLSRRTSKCPRNIDVPEECNETAKQREGFRNEEIDPVYDGPHFVLGP